MFKTCEARNVSPDACRQIPIFYRRLTHKQQLALHQGRRYRVNLTDAENMRAHRILRETRIGDEACENETFRKLFLWPAQFGKFTSGPWNGDK